MITSEFCKEEHIPTVYLSRLVKKGIYLSEDGVVDDFYFFQYRYKKAIFSYETALYLLGLTDKIPQIMDVTVNTNYKFNVSRAGVTIHYVKADLLTIGVVETKTILGNLVKVYSYERTLCDFISHKSDMDPEVYVNLIRSYSDYKDKNIHNLYEIADKMNVVSEVRDIMEVVYE